MELYDSLFSTIRDVVHFLLTHADKAILTFALNGDIQYGVYTEDNELTICYATREDKTSFSIITKQRKVIQCFETRISGEEWVVNGNQIEKQVVMDLSSEGDRWEGDVYNHIPYGWGTLWNRENHVIYEGFQIGENHHGFGIHYSKMYTKEYEGTWCNGVKHGFGTLFDSKGTILYNGVYYNNEFPESSIVITKKMTLTSISNTLVSLTLQNDCCKSLYHFCLISLPLIESIQIGKGCFSAISMKGYDIVRKATPEEECMFGSFCIASCPKLKKLQLIPEAFNNMKSCTFRDLPALEMLLIRDRSFVKCQSLCIQGIFHC